MTPQLVASVERILLHYLDHEILDIYSLLDNYGASRVRSEFERLTRLALMLCGHAVVLPASAYCENPLAKRVIDQFAEFIHHGYVTFASSSYGCEDFLAEKRQEYARDPTRYPVYSARTRKAQSVLRDVVWHKRERSSRTDIGARWQESVEAEHEIWRALVLRRGSHSIEQYYDGISTVPHTLQEHRTAFIADYAIGHLPVSGLTTQEGKDVGVLITAAYVGSFAADYRAACLDDLLLFETSQVLADVATRLSARRAWDVLRLLGCQGPICDLASPQLFALRRRRGWDDFRIAVLLPCAADRELFAQLRTGMLECSCRPFAEGFRQTGDYVDVLESFLLATAATLKPWSTQPTKEGILVPGKLDWLGAMAEAVVVLAGPIAAPLKFLVELRKSGRRVTEQDRAQASADFGEAGTDLAVRVADNLEEYAASVELPVDVAGLEAYFRSMQSRFEARKTELRQQLTRYISRTRDIERLLDDVLIERGRIDCTGSAEDVWHDVIDYLDGGDPILTFQFLYEVMREKPGIGVARELLG